MKMPGLFFALLLFGSASMLRADSVRLENFKYPFPVKTFHFTNQQQALEMVYMEVRPEKTARGTVLLLHGKNFSGAYWKETAEFLRKAGYRVVIPDQIGFGIIEAGTLPVFFSSTCNKHPCPFAIARDQASACSRSFDGRNARRSLRLAFPG